MGKSLPAGTQPRFVGHPSGFHDSLSNAVAGAVVLASYDRAWALEEQESRMPLLLEYESRFEWEYGYFRPAIQELVERYLDCGNPMCGFARIRCPDCGEERFLMFSCKTRGFYPSCHAKRCEEWWEWMREEFLLDVPHRQIVFTIPKMLRLFFRFKRKLLNSLCLSAVRTLVRFLHTVTGLELMPGVVAVIQTFGDRINFHPHIHVLITEGGTTPDGVFHRVCVDHNRSPS